MGLQVLANGSGPNIDSAVGFDQNAFIDLEQQTGWSVVYRVVVNIATVCNMGYGFAVGDGFGVPSDDFRNGDIVSTLHHPQGDA